MKKFLFRAVASFTVTINLLISILSVPVGAAAEPMPNNCSAALVYCIQVDKVLWSVNPDKIVYPAALTKLMTAVIVSESIENGSLGMDEYVTASNSVDKISGNSISIKPGESLRVRDLLSALFLSGANDAAVVLSEKISGSVDNFVAQMNKRAGELGMKNTVYTNPTGLHNDGMVTTANDLLILAKHASNIHIITDICRSEKAVIPATNKSTDRTLITRNYLISKRITSDYYLSTATGMICGSTYEAGYCIIATAQHDGLNYISIVLGSNDTKVLQTPESTSTDENGKTVVTPAVYKYIMSGFVKSKELLSWADNNFGYFKAVDENTPICQIPVNLANGIDSIALLPETSVEIFVPKDINKEEDIKLSWSLDYDQLTAPINSGYKAGLLTVLYKGEKVGEVSLVVKGNIAENGGLRLLNEISLLIRTPFFLILLIVFILGITFYIISTAYYRSRKKANAKKEMIRQNRYLK